jgi:four helix bundle protein
MKEGLSPVEGGVLSFQRLEVYQRSIEFHALVVRAIADVPRGHGPILDQLRRAAGSTPLNIAEGAGRTGAADAARCYAIARGSAMECAAALDVCRQLGLVNDAVHGEGITLLERIVAMLTKMCRT